MTPTEAVTLTRLVKAICPQQQFDEYTADAWADLLDDLRLEDCKLAVRQLGQTQAFVAPSEIRSTVRKIRADRIDRTPMPDPDPDMTPVETIQWLRETRKAIADGTYTPPPELERKPRDMRFVGDIAERKAIEAAVEDEDAA